ncbi:hypothetical protein ACF061_13020 [Streptomyces sp. NPDC015220]|uniref:hypothetical protein n=1 Tax=Streptomyces sp. NPDC015220 TaxID=3364947 RepID=UPI0037028D3D
MREGIRRTLPRQLLWTLVAAAVSAAAWAAWLGWDQRRDVHPDGSTTGPYEAWQVAGLILTLLVAVCWAASRRHVVAAVLGPTAGLTGAAFYDWSDDASGLFVVGVGLVMLGSLAGTSAVAAVTAAVQRAGRRG